MQKRRVLIVDDDEVDRLIYERHLSLEEDGLETATAASVDEGLALFGEGDFDCVMLDYRIPPGDGLQALARIRELDPFCPVVMLTGVGDERTAVAAMKQGAADYLVKGNHSPIELRRTVSNVIETAILKRHLDSANQRMLTVLETVTSAIVALNRQREIVLINPAARHMLGGISTEVPFPWPESIRFLDRDDLRPLDASRSPVNRALVGQRLVEEVNLLARSASGPGRYVRVSSSLADDRDSNIRAVLVLDDVTEAVTSRQQVDRASRLDALGQLTGGVAHDFNNLLGTLLYAVELAALEPQSERIDRVLRIAKKSIRRGTDLTSRLLAFAKRQPTLESARPIANVLSDLIAIAEPTIEDDIALAADLPDKELRAVCDQAQLENALLNLILNARDAIARTGRGGTIWLTGRELPTATDGNKATAKQVEISIRDNGSGMSDEVRRRSIDPFFTTKDSSSGTGLGLSMVYGFIQQANGELVIESAPDVGTTVRLILPGSPPKAAPPPPPEPKALPRGRGETVLIIEDETNLRIVMRDMLEALGYRSISAQSGAEALQILDAHSDFDLLLTDIVLPGGVGGFELARKFRQRHPKLPIIYMSGYTGFTEEEMGDVVAPLISKPCLPAEMAEAIREAIDTAPKHASPV